MGAKLSGLTKYRALLAFVLGKKGIQVRGDVGGVAAEMRPSRKELGTSLLDVLHEELALQQQDVALLPEELRDSVQHAA